MIALKTGGKITVKNVIWVDSSTAISRQDFKQNVLKLVLSNSPLIIIKYTPLHGAPLPLCRKEQQGKNCYCSKDVLQLQLIEKINSAWNWHKIFLSFLVK